jgi:DNA-binding HxlR family transcriptional regulator
MKNDENFNSKKNKELLKNILRSKNKRIIFYIIKDKENFMGKDLLIYIKYRSHLSRTLKELENLGIIKCENKEDINFKFYKVTSKAKQLSEQFLKYYEPKNDNLN